jgi:hypothetical protein
VEETLVRLGIEEIEERMEVSPLLTAGDVQDVDREGDFTCCSCKMEPDPPVPDAPPTTPGDPPL